MCVCECEHMGMYEDWLCVCVRGQVTMYGKCVVCSWVYIYICVYFVCMLYICACVYYIYMKIYMCIYVHVFCDYTFYIYIWVYTRENL